MVNLHFLGKDVVPTNIEVRPITVITIMFVILAKPNRVITQHLLDQKKSFVNSFLCQFSVTEYWKITLP